MFSFIRKPGTCEAHYAEPTHPSVQYGLASKLFGHQTVLKRSFKIEFY